MKGEREIWMEKKSEKKETNVLGATHDDHHLVRGHYVRGLMSAGSPRCH